MRDFREILDKSELAEAPRGSVTKADLDKHKIKKSKKFTWDQINTALTLYGMAPKDIATFIIALNKVVKEKLVVKMDETTTAGAGTGDYHPPLGMSRRDKDAFSSSRAMLKQFNQRTGTMARNDMLSTTRKMGLSLGHLKDDDIRKTLTGMSVRNKRKFMGTSMGMGMGSIDKWVKKPVKVKV